MNEDKSYRQTLILILLVALAAVVLLVIVFTSFDRSDSPEPEGTPTPGSSTVTPETQSATPALPTVSPKPAVTPMPKPTAGTETEAPTASPTTDVPAATASPHPSTPSPTVTPAPSPTPDPHTHSWNPVFSTILHEEAGHFETVVIQAAYDEPVKVFMNICTVCGATGGNDIPDHIDAVHGGAGGYYADYVPTGEVIRHEAITEQQWVVDSPAYTEQVISYYICHVCGEIRKLE